MKKLLSALAAGMAVSLIATAAFAGEAVSTETIVETKTTVSAVSANGLVNIDLPDSGWKEIETDEANVLFSNGNSGILFNVYKEDAELPARTHSDAEHEYAYEITVCNKEYVYIATGIIFDQEEYDEVVEAIRSLEVNEDKITDELCNHEPIVEDNYSVQEVSYDVWVNTDVLNLRAGGSTDYSVITGVTYGTKIAATGVVLKNGEPTGWTRLDYNGTTAYAATSFLSTTEITPAPQPAADSSDDVPTAEPSYMGYSYEGFDPWGGYICISLKSTDGEYLNWTITDVVDADHLIDRELYETPFHSGYGEWYIEGTMGQNEDMYYSYSGILQLQGGGIEFTFTSGEIGSRSEEGGSTAHMVDALSLEDRTIELYKIN